MPFLVHIHSHLSRHIFSLEYFRLFCLRMFRIDMCSKSLLGQKTKTAYFAHKPKIRSKWRAGIRQLNYYMYNVVFTIFGIVIIFPKDYYRKSSIRYLRKCLWNKKTNILIDNILRLISMINSRNSIVFGENDSSPIL